MLLFFFQYSMNTHVHRYVLMIVFVLAAFFRLFLFFSDYHEIWWDSGVYIGMGKYLFSGGQVGIWEGIRPVLWPVILGFGWLLGFDPDFFGRVLTLVLSLGCLLLLYRIAKRTCDEHTALVALTIFAFSPIFFYLGFHTYTEIPSLFFLLLSLVFLLNERIFVAGLFLGASTLIRFPMGIFIIPVCLYLFLSTRRLSRISTFIAAFMISLTPFFILNYFFYGNILTPFLAGSAAIKSVLGCNVLRYQEWYVYLFWLFSEHPLHFFALFGLFSHVFSRVRLSSHEKIYTPKMCCERERTAHFITRENILLFSSMFMPLVYYSLLHCKDYRYLLSFLPFITLFTAQGITFLFNVFSTKISAFHKKHVYVALFLFVLGTSFWQGLWYYYGNENTQKDTVAIDYFTYFKNKPHTGELWTANPLTAAYSDSYFEKVYYPVYHQQQYNTFFDYVQNNTSRMSGVLLDTCGGGIICHPDDSVCKNKTEELFYFLTKNFLLAYNKTNGMCSYVVFTRKNSTVSEAN